MPPLLLLLLLLPRRRWWLLTVRKAGERRDRHPKETGREERPLRQPSVSGAPALVAPLGKTGMPLPPPLPRLLLLPPPLRVL